jgi:transcription antitermination factor NusG
MRACINPDLSWFVATYRPRKAPDAQKAILDLGVDVYLPMMRADRWSKNEGCRIEYEAPLIPPYIFVGFKPDGINFQAVDDLVHVGRFIRDSERRPVKLLSPLVEAIFLAERNGEYDESDRAKKARKEETETLFPPGSAVKLLDDLRGLLAGFSGTVIESKRGRRHVETPYGLRAWIDVDKLDEVA